MGSSSTAEGTFYGTEASNGNFATIGYVAGPNNIREYTFELCSGSYSSTIKRI